MQVISLQLDLPGTLNSYMQPRFVLPGKALFLLRKKLSPSAGLKKAEFFTQLFHILYKTAFVVYSYSWKEVYFISAAKRDLKRSD